MKIVPGLVVALVPASLALAIAFGSVDLGPEQLADALLFRGDEIAREIVWGVRAPRALAAFACGGLLALAGALLQVLLRNPLADPAILGVSGGAAAGALAATLLGVGAAGLNLAALAGASIAAGAVFAFSLGRSGWNPYRVLLTGVALASGIGALVGLMLSLAPRRRPPNFRSASSPRRSASPCCSSSSGDCADAGGRRTRTLRGRARARSRARPLARAGRFLVPSRAQRRGQDEPRPRSRRIALPASRNRRARRRRAGRALARRARPAHRRAAPGRGTRFRG